MYCSCVSASQISLPLPCFFLPVVVWAVIAAVVPSDREERARRGAAGEPVSEKHAFVLVCP